MDRAPASAQAHPPFVEQKAAEAEKDVVSQMVVNRLAGSLGPGRGSLEEGG